MKSKKSNVKALRTQKNPKNDWFLRFFKSDLGSARTHISCGIAGGMGASRTREVVRKILNVSASSFTIIEICMVFLIIFAVTFLILPHSLDNTIQAKLISQWTQKYSEIEYTFSVIKAQQNGVIIKTVPNGDGKLLELIKPYFRVSAPVKSKYTQTFRNNSEIKGNSMYYFNMFYYSNMNEILGFKQINKNCNIKNQICAIMSFDINGLEKPNSWGRDIYGIYIYKDRIEPIGKNVLQDILRADCDKKGTGVYCSYYYLMGGKFD